MSAALQLDSYKIGHPIQYPENTTTIYANLTARSGERANIPNSKGVYFVGLQHFLIDYLQNEWNNTFFSKPKSMVVKDFQRFASANLGYTVDVSHIEALHDIGYLPIVVKALPEGSFVPYNVPMLTIRNTLSDFAWVVNMIETVLSSELWQPITSATTYMAYKKIFHEYAIRTGSPLDFVNRQGHDFSFRGMAGRKAAASSGFASIACGSIGTDCIPALLLAEKYYDANVENEIVGESINGTEHSVMCVNGQEMEFDTIKRIITEVYPEGNVAIVVDGYDFWKVVTEYLPLLKNDIMSRNGTVMIRPDSGDPVKIMTGDDDYPKGSPEYNGLIETLWGIFGGTTTKLGFKVLDSHIGAIYGDSITYDRADRILNNLYNKQFASCNVVLGIGSYTYQYVTRDTHGIAMKTTFAIVDDEHKVVSKSPKTDSGMKTSAKGLLMVSKENGEYKLWQNVTPKQENHGCLEPVFKNGVLTKFQSLSDIRNLTQL